MPKSSFDIKSTWKPWKLSSLVNLHNALSRPIGGTLVNLEHPLSRT
jgi:hypothetical protein